MSGKSHFFAQHQRNSYLPKRGRGGEGENISGPDLGREGGRKEGTNEDVATSVSCYGPDDLEIPLAAPGGFLEREREGEMA